MTMFKKIITIALSIVCFSNLLVSAASSSVDVFSDDFTGYTVGIGEETGLTNEYVFAGSPVGDCGIEATDKGKSLYLDLDAGSDNTRIYKTFDSAYSTDVLNIEYSVKPGAGIETLFWVYTGAGANYPLTYFTSTGNVVAGTSWEEVMPSWTSGQWYDVKAVADFELDIVDISITDGVHVYEKIIDLTIADIKTIDMQIWSNADSGSYFDDIKVTAQQKTWIPYANDFSKSHLLGMYPSNGAQDYVGIVNSGEAAHGNVFKLHYTDGTAPMLNYGHIPSGTNKLGIKASVKPDISNRTMLSFRHPDGSWMSVVSFAQDGKIEVQWDMQKTGIRYTSGKWYDIEAVADLEADTVDVLISDESGPLGKYTITDYTNEISELYFQIWGTDGVAASSYIDNIVITDTPEDIPEITLPPQLPYSNDFTSGELSKLYAEGYGEGCAGVVDLGGTHGNAYKLQYSNGTAPRLNYDFGVGETYDKVGIKVSVKPDSLNRTMISLKDDSAAGFMSLVSFAQDGKIEIQWDSRKTGVSYTSGKWYDIEAVADFTLGIINILISDEDGTIGTYKITNYTNTVTGAMFHIWGTEGIEASASYFDDIVMTDEPEPLPDLSVLNLPITDDFEGYTDYASASGVWLSNTGAFLTSIENSDYGKALRVGLDKSTDNTWVRRSIVSSINSGKVKFSYDVKPGGGIHTITMALNQNGAPVNLVSFTDFGKVYACTPGEDVSTYDRVQLGNYTAGKWYHCEAVVDLDNKRMDVSYTGDDASGTLTDIAYENYTGEVEYITGAGVQVWTKQNGASYYDNLKIEYCTDAPKLSSDGVVILKDGTAQKDLNNVKASSDSVRINFNAVMNPLSIEKKISVVKPSDGSKVDFTAAVNGNFVTLKFDKGLEPEMKYCLTIAPDAENILGQRLEKSYSMEFITGKGEFIVSLTGIAREETEVKNLAELAGEKPVTVGIKYENSTREAKNMVLIYNYYNGFKQVACKCIPIKVEADDIRGTYYDTRDVSSLDGVDNVKVMLWDGFDNIIPLSDSITLE